MENLRSYAKRITALMVSAMFWGGIVAFESSCAAKGFRPAMPIQSSGEAANSSTNRKDESKLVPVSNDSIWSISCKGDPITDGRSCFVTDGGIIAVFTKTPATKLVSGFGVTGNVFPGSEIAARVDSNPPVRWLNHQFPKGSFDSLVEQMSKGKKAVFQFHEWPSNAHQEEEVPLKGFAEAVQEAKKRVLGAERER